MQHFLDCIHTAKKPLTSGLEGLQVVQLLEAASESLRKGGAKVDTPDLRTIMIENRSNAVEISHDQGVHKVA